MDCRSARPHTSRPTAELVIVIFDQNISVCRTDHSTKLDNKPYKGVAEYLRSLQCASI